MVLSQAEQQNTSGTRPTVTSSSGVAAAPRSVPRAAQKMLQAKKSDRPVFVTPIRLLLRRSARGMFAGRTPSTVFQTEGICSVRVIRPKRNQARAMGVRSTVLLLPQASAAPRKSKWVGGCSGRVFQASST